MVGTEVTVGAALCGAAAIRDAEMMHSLLTWLKSIVVQNLYTHKLHSWWFLVVATALTRKSRKVKE